MKRVQTNPATIHGFQDQRSGNVRLRRTRDEFGFGDLYDQSMRTKIREIRNALTRRPLYLLLAAALLHISVPAAVLTVGQYQLMPAQFRANGLGEFASDCFPYREEVGDLVGVLKNSGPLTWPPGPRNCTFGFIRFRWPLSLAGSALAFWRSNL